MQTMLRFVEIPFMETSSSKNPDNQESLIAGRFRKLKHKINNHFVLFVVIGFCTFALDYFLYFFFLDIEIPLNIAKATSSSIAVLFNYIFNSHFNFGGNNVMHAKSLLLYFGLYAILIVIHVVLNQIFLTITNHEQYAVILAMGVSVFINYFSVKKFFYYQNIK